MLPNTLRLGALLLLSLLGACGLALAEEEPGTYAGRDADWWIGQFRDAEGGQAAHVALRKIGRPALEPLAKALRSQEHNVRYGAVRALGAMGPQVGPVLPQVIACLAVNDLPFTLQLLGVVKNTGAAAAPYLETLVPFMDATDRNVVLHTLAILSPLGAAAQSAVPRMLERTRTGPADLRRSFLSTAVELAPQDPDVMAVMIELWERSDDRERVQLLGLASRIPANSAGLAELLSRAASDLASDVRAAAVPLLGKVALEAPEHIDTLIRLLSDPAHEVRSRAAYSLKGLGTRAVGAVSALEAVLDDPDQTAHVAAIRALAAIGLPAMSAFSRVLAAAERANPPLELLNAAKAYFAGAPEFTAQAAASQNARVRAMAIEILSNWPRERWAGVLAQVFDALIEVLQTSEKMHHHETRILDTLAQMADDEPDALRVLLAMASARLEPLRNHAARLVGTKPAQSELLLELLTSSLPLERDFAQAALQSGLRMGPGDLLRTRLLVFLRHEDIDVRERALRLIVGAQNYLDLATLDPRDGEVLAAGSAGLLGDPALASAALTCLSSLGPYAVPHLPAIALLLADDSLNSLGTQAAWALARLGRTSASAQETATALLLERLLGEDPVASAHGAVGLTSNRDVDEALLRVLPALIRSERKSVHFPAVDASQHMGPRAAALVPVLAELVEKPLAHSHVDQWARNALAAIAPDDERTVRALLVALADPLRQQSAEATIAALRRGGDTAIGLVAAALAEATNAVRLHLLTVLASYGLRASRVREQVRPFITDPDARVAQAATGALTALGG